MAGLASGDLAGCRCLTAYTVFLNGWLGMWLPSAVVCWFDGWGYVLAGWLCGSLAISLLVWLLWLYGWLTIYVAG